MPHRKPILREQMLSMPLRDEPQNPQSHPLVAPFTRVVTLYVPRRLASHRPENARAVLDEVNARIAQRGYVEPDGQILLTPILEAVELHMIDLWGCSSEEEVVRRAKIGMIGAQVDEDLDVAYRPWGPEQARYFGLESPYQLSEDPDEYGGWHVQFLLSAPYLAQDERILGLLHGGRDNAYFYCTCHQASVVYTTRHRLICMGCGFLHAVVASPLAIKAPTRLSCDEWRDHFDAGGAKNEEEISLTLIDFQDIENARMIWTTSQWEDARHRFLFFSRSTPEEIEKAIRGTEMDASIFLNAGFRPVATEQPPAHQIAEDSVHVGLFENAIYSLSAGVRFYLAGKNESSELVNAIPALFRTVELLLKERLQRTDQQALQDQPNNPTVLRRLKAAGVPITIDEDKHIAALRKLRNDLQHGTARFNQRAGLRACRAIMIFIDQFMFSELSTHLGDHITEADWFQLLEIPEIATTATGVTNVRLDRIRKQQNATIEICTRCSRHAMVRAHPCTGISCWYCGYVPILQVADIDDQQ
jgi:hypothetical protein